MRLSNNLSRQEANPLSHLPAPISISGFTVPVLNSTYLEIEPVLVNLVHSWFESSNLIGPHEVIDFA